MDRSLVKAPTALLGAWLEAPAKEREDHALLKAILNSKASYHTHCNIRQKVKDIAHTQEEWTEMLQCEQDRSKLQDEPLWIPMS